MKLYVYDHCPYCVKARMIFGYKNINIDLEYLLNDDEEKPVSMIGQKMTPILEKDDGSFMPESLDIIDYIDKNFGDVFIDTDVEFDSNLSDWITASRDYLYPLAMPRWTQVGLEEFKTQSAVDYFTKKKEDSIGSFEKHLSDTEALVAKADAHLLELDKIITENQSFFSGKPSINDIHLYPTLRCLSVSKDVTFPINVLDYMEEQEELTKVPLHLDISI